MFLYIYNDIIFHLHQKNYKNQLHQNKIQKDFVHN